MKKIIIVLAIAFSSIANAQLNANAQLIKDKAYDEFQKIELVVQQNRTTDDPIYDMMINHQCDALIRYIKSKAPVPARYLERVTKTINGVETVNYALLMIYLEK